MPAYDPNGNEIGVTGGVTTTNSPSGAGQVLTSTTTTTATWQTSTVPTFPFFTNFMYLTNQPFTWTVIAQLMSLTVLQTQGSAFTLTSATTVKVNINCKLWVMAQLQTVAGVTGNFKIALFKNGSNIFPLIGLPGFTGDSTACAGNYVDSFAANDNLTISAVGPNGASSGATGLMLFLYQIS